jgi:hypothetical protein
LPKLFWRSFTAKCQIRAQVAEGQIVPVFFTQRGQQCSALDQVKQDVYE